MIFLNQPIIGIQKKVLGANSSYILKALIVLIFYRFLTIQFRVPEGIFSSIGADFRYFAKSGSCSKDVTILLQPRCANLMY
jgi:hypothetical protein